jgi:uncharacterized membrane protein
MFGFVVGTLSLIGLVGLIGGHHRHGHHRWHGRRGWHGGGGDWGRARGRRGWREGVGRAAGEVLKRRLRIDEDQEGIVDLAMADVRKALTELGTVLRDSRSEVADALRGEEVDAATLDAVFALQDEALADARRQVVSAVKQIHAVLEPEQRQAAADWLGTADPRWV